MQFVILNYITVFNYIW